MRVSGIARSTVIVFEIEKVERNYEVCQMNDRSKTGRSELGIVFDCCNSTCNFLLGWLFQGVKLYEYVFLNSKWLFYQINIRK